MLFDDKRQLRRVSTDIPVTIQVVQPPGNIHVAGPVAGKLKDFSPRGAAITLHSIQAGPHHLFFSCQADGDYLLLLDLAKPGSTGPLLIPCRPIWYDRELDSANKPFVIGVQFQLPSDSEPIRQLINEVCAGSTEPRKWWQALTG